MLPALTAFRISTVLSIDCNQVSKEALTTRCVVLINHEALFIVAAASHEQQ